MRQRSITFRLILVTSLLMVALVGSISAWSWYALTRIISASQEELYRERSHTVLRLLEKKYERLLQTGLRELYEDEFMRQALVDLHGLYPADRQVRLDVFDSRGNDLLARFRAQGVAPSLDIPAFSALDGTHVATSKGEWHHAVPFKPWNWIVVFSVPVERKFTDRTRFFLVLLPFALLATILLLIVLHVALRRIMLPVGALVQASSAMAGGDLTARLPENAVGELRDLARHFARMRDAIRDQMDALQERERNLKTTLESIGEGVVTTDRNGAVTRINPAALVIAGKEESDILGHRLEAVLAIGRAEGPLCIESVVASNGVIPFDERTTLTSGAGERKRIVGSASPIHDETGEIVGMVAVFRDVTRDLSLREQLHQSQKMEAVGQLVGGVAHDFNNALGAILTAVELIRDEGNLSPSQDECSDIILAASERARDLTKKLLGFSRRASRTKVPLDCARVLQDTIELLKHSVDKSISIVLTNHATRTTVSGDRSLLQNAFMNLGINASHAMPEGGTLEVALENIHLDEAHCAASPFGLKPGDHLCILVRDTGIGMAPEIMARIFEPFFTTKREGQGTGLGLASVYGAVQDHGGEISVSSEVGVGSTFRIHLPTTAAPLPVKVVEHAPRGSGTILLIDDEEFVRSTSSTLLRSLGYEVIAAENGRVAVDLFADNPGAVDLIILDMIMPVMGGREAFGKLRAIRSDVPIVISSGFAKAEDLAELQAQGVSGFLDKPFRRTDLAGLVKKLIPPAG